MKNPQLIEDLDDSIAAALPPINNAQVSDSGEEPQQELIDLDAIVSEFFDGHRLDAAAAQSFPYSRAKLQGWIEAGCVTVDDVVVNKIRHVVKEGQILRLRATLLVEGKVLPQDLPLDILYQDEHLLVINKPAGFTVHPGAGEPDGTVQNALLHYFPQSALVPRAGIVHRLDKDTTGLMVVAKTLPTYTKLVEMIAARTVRREYLALVNGDVVAGGTIDAPIARHPRERIKMAVVLTGRPAISHYRVERRFTYHTLLRVRLETGRTHQIRVHCAHIRHPVTADPVYGGVVQRGRGLSVEQRKMLSDFKRQALHATELAFAHPITDAPLHFHAPLPADFQALLAVL
jgi:23S rRNA pseudouridine1911/1915/1917 synthase